MSIFKKEGFPTIDICTVIGNIDTVDK